MNIEQLEQEIDDVLRGKSNHSIVELRAELYAKMEYYDELNWKLFLIKLGKHRMDTTEEGLRLKQEGKPRRKKITTDLLSEIFKGPGFNLLGMMAMHFLVVILSHRFSVNEFEDGVVDEANQQLELYLVALGPTL